MTNTETIETLKRLEDFRIKLDNGEIQAGCADWIVRMCQAKVAQNHFTNRMEWTALIRHEQKAREAFWGGKRNEILTQEYPNGCTLQEAIDYFIKHGEELEVIGLI